MAPGEELDLEALRRAVLRLVFMATVYEEAHDAKKKGGVYEAEYDLYKRDATTLLRQIVALIDKVDELIDKQKSNCRVGPGQVAL